MLDDDKKRELMLDIRIKLYFYVHWCISYKKKKNYVYNAYALFTFIGK